LLLLNGSRISRKANLKSEISRFMGRMSMDRVFFCADTLLLKILLKIFSSLLEMQIKLAQLSLTSLLLKRQQDT
jgi:hypothetical protein